MITETEFLERWHKERAMYDAMGKLLVTEVARVVGAEIGCDPSHGFFKVPLSHRLKTDESMLAKAFKRKAYADPYGQVEDKVGVRAVVLFVEDIKVVERAITGSRTWRTEKSRDFQDERLEKPFEFDYQSIHYIVRAGNDCTFGDTIIDMDTPCEFQIRTLLQHAYSELTHDTIYKPSIRVQPEVKRAAAKSMALIEATDDYFMQVRKLLSIVEEPGRALGTMLSQVFRERTAKTGEIGALHRLIIDHYRSEIEKVTREDVEALLDSKPYITSRIQQRYREMSLFRAPAILLVYWIVANAPYATSFEDRPISDDELGLIYSDLGLSIPGN